MRNNLIAISLILVSFDSLADTKAFNDGCDNQKQTNTSYLRCLDTQLGQVNRERDAWINQIVMRLDDEARNRGNTASQMMFERAQSHYKNYMTDSCKWRYQTLLPDTVAAAIDYKRCQLYHTQLLIKSMELP